MLMSCCLPQYLSNDSGSELLGLVLTCIAEFRTVNLDLTSVPDRPGSAADPPCAVCRDICLDLSVALRNNSNCVRAAYAADDYTSLGKAAAETALRRAARYADPEQVRDMVKLLKAELPPAPHMPAAKRQKTG